MKISAEVRAAETTTSESIPYLRQLEHAIERAIAHHELVAATIENKQEREGFVAVPTWSGRRPHWSGSADASRLSWQSDSVVPHVTGWPRYEHGQPDLIHAAAGRTAEPNGGEPDGRLEPGVQDVRCDHRGVPALEARRLDGVARLQILDQPGVAAVAKCPLVGHPRTLAEHLRARPAKLGARFARHLEGPGRAHGRDGGNRAGDRRTA